MSIRLSCPKQGGKAELRVTKIQNNMRNWHKRNMAPNDVFDDWTSRGSVIWLQPVSCAGGNPELDG